VQVLTLHAHRFRSYKWTCDGLAGGATWSGAQTGTSGDLGSCWCPGSATTAHRPGRHTRTGTLGGIWPSSARWPAAGQCGTAHRM